MGWSNDEKTTSNKKAMDTSSKILLAIIACVVFIIILIIVLLMNVQQTTFTINVDGLSRSDITKEDLITKIDGVTYIDIENFAKLVKYEYHKGEYKFFTIDQGKCYVQGENETASFYVNDNKICKLPIDKFEEDYNEYTVENTIRSKENKMYATVEAINIAFNVIVDEKENFIEIYTLDGLITNYDKKVKDWGYAGIIEQEFENKKSLLYGYLIVKKENGMYKIIDINNTKEIVSDRYTSIQFSENTKEYFVTNSLGQVGIINLDGTTKIEPTYEAISILDKNSDLYLVQKDKKYGVVKSGNTTIIYPEYDAIGINEKNLNASIENRYLILDTLIPVSKNNKWGCFDKDGKMILNIEYDGLGCYLTAVEVSGIKKTVEPVLSIKRCNGIVVKKSDKYGVIDITGKELVPVAVESIYSIENITDEDLKYFMIYNGGELNVIQRLIQAGLLKEKDAINEDSNTVNSNVVDNKKNNIITNNTISANK